MNCLKKNKDINKKRNLVTKETKILLKMFIFQLKSFTSNKTITTHSKITKTRARVNIGKTIHKKIQKKFAPLALANTPKKLDSLPIFP